MSADPVPPIDELLSLKHGYGALHAELAKRMPDLPAAHIQLKNVTASVEVHAETQFDVPNVVKALKGLFTEPCKKVAKEPLYLLRDVTLDFAPGTSTMVLAPPGHGKSSLVKAMAGQLVQPTTGSITYNGFSAEESPALVKKLVALVRQEDVHMPQLSVRETFDFAAKNSNLATDLPDDPLVRGFREQLTDVMLKVLHLEGCADTPVGSDLVRGVSGGEKRRVSVGEMLLLPSRALLLDQYSTGLDAGTTITLSQALVDWAHATNGTVVSTLLQPPPEVVAMYDRIVVLREGAVVYAGPQADTVAYFTSLGFVEDKSMDATDFVLEMITDPAAWAEAHPDPNGVVPPLDTDSLVKAWSAQQQPLPQPNKSLGVLSNPFAEKQFGQANAIGLGESIRECFRRQGKLIIRDKQFLGAHIGQSIMLTLLLGALFWMLDTDEFQLRVGLLLFTPTLLAFNNMAEVPIALNAKQVVKKHLAAGMYTSKPYVLAVNACHFPLAFFEAVVYSTGVYFMSGFATTAPAFGFFLLANLMAGWGSAAVFRNISYVVPSMEIGQVLVGPVNAVLVLFGGIMITRSNVPPWFIWAYYLSPFSWLIRSLSINEFSTEDYDVIASNSTQRIGDLFLDAYEMQNGQLWKWGGLIYILGGSLVMILLSIWLLDRLKRDVARGTSRTKQETGDAEAVKLRVDPAAANSSFPFAPATLTFKDLSYVVPVDEGEKTLLHKISGFAKPGELTALMGASGAGKTTLMDVIADRKTGGKLSGDVLINGRVRDEDFARIIGYCEQNDLHEPYSTVGEALFFAGRLRLPSSVPTEQVQRFVDEVLQLLELAALRDRMVGGENRTDGLSHGQLKRLTVACELMANPSILLLDEPTSHLDSKQAEDVMRAVANVARAGRTVVCTIHQPNSTIFHAFDRLLLMQRGGFVVYNGPLPKLQGYLESQPGTPPKPDQQNPGTWMLNVLEQGEANYADAYLKSSFFTETQEELTEAATAAPVSRPAEPLSALHEFHLVFARLNTSMFRNVGYNFVRIVVFVVLGLLFGLAYFDVETEDLAGISTVMSAIFMTSVFSGAIHLLAGIPLHASFRPVINREVAANTYRRWFHNVAIGLAEVPYITLCTVLFLALFYPLAGFSGDSEVFIIYAVGQLTVSFVTAFLAQFLAAALPTAELATLCGSSVLSFSFLFGGLFANGPAIPLPLQWIWHAMFTKYALTAMIVPQFFCDGPDCPTIEIQTASGVTVSTQSDYVQGFLGLRYDDRWNAIAILCAFALGAWFASFLAARFIKQVSR